MRFRDEQDRLEAIEMLLFRVALSCAVVCLGVLACVAIVVYVVGDRAPSPSPGVPATATRPVLDSEAAPARSPASGVCLARSGEDAKRAFAARSGTCADGNGEDAVPLEEAQASVVPVLAALPAEPASTVVVHALTSTPVVTAVATARPVVTQAVESSNSALIAASPWPVHLHATVACLVQRESRWVATAVGAAGERGILQVHPITWPYLAQHGITPDMLFDPATNLRAGYLLYLEAGSLRPWGGGCA